MNCPASTSPMAMRPNNGRATTRFVTLSTPDWFQDVCDELYCVASGERQRRDMPGQPRSPCRRSRRHDGRSAGYRFLVRRMEHALVRWDARMLADPMRSQREGLPLGWCSPCSAWPPAACSRCSACRTRSATTRFSSPRTPARCSSLGDTVHPVLNLASARLAANEPAEPAIVADDQLAAKIARRAGRHPGAPSALEPPTPPAGLDRL